MSTLLPRLLNRMLSSLAGESQTLVGICSHLRLKARRPKRKMLILRSLAQLLLGKERVGASVIVMKKKRKRNLVATKRTFRERRRKIMKNSSKR